MELNAKNIAEIKLENLNYFLVPSRRRGYCEYGMMQDQIYDFWTNQWHQAFNRSGTPKKGWEDHFMRQDLISALVVNGRVVGCLLFTFYDVQSRAAIGSEYFSYIEEQTVKDLKQMNIKDVMSVEYLAIDENYSLNSLGVSLGKVIIALAAYVAQDQGVDAIISMPIFGTKVDQMLGNVGGRVIQPDIKKYGYTLNLMMATSQPASKGSDLKVRAITDHLWLRRFDYSRRANFLQTAV